MKKNIFHIVTLIAFSNILFSQGNALHLTGKNHMNNLIVEKLIKPVKIELTKTTLLDGRNNSWWNTPEYWEEKELDGVRAIIFYTISDSTKALKAIRLHLDEDPETFKYHTEVSSLLGKIAHQFPSECLRLLDELMLDYKPGMKLFDPYGDLIFRLLFEKLPTDQIDALQLNLVSFFKKEEFEFLNWGPMFNLLYKYGDTKYLRQVIQENQERFKPIDLQGYYSVIIQAKAKVYGFEVYPELLSILKLNPENKSRLKFALYAIQTIGSNHQLKETQISQIKNDLLGIVIGPEFQELIIQTIEEIEGGQ